MLSADPTLHAEIRDMPWQVRMAVPTTILGLGVLIWSCLLPASWYWWPEAAAVTIAAATVGWFVPVRSRAAVHPDRITVSLHVTGLRVRCRNVQWPSVSRCDIVRKKPTDNYHHVWHRSHGMVAVMFAGDGVSMRLKDRPEMVVGSDDPDRLLAAINAARRSQPAAVNPGQ